MLIHVLLVASGAALQAPFSRAQATVQPVPPAGFEWADFSEARGKVVPTARVAKAVAPVDGPVQPFDPAATYDGEGFIDEATMTEATWRTFTMSPDVAVKKARWVLAEPRIGLKDGGACLSADFEFQAPIIGPLDKERFTGALDAIVCGARARLVPYAARLIWVCAEEVVILAPVSYTHLTLPTILLV